jgi:uncharacterized membrane protein YphA (DoxX/SURF4 family)
VKRAVDNQDGRDDDVPNRFPSRRHLSRDAVARRARERHQECQPMTYALWIVQVLLAALFLFAGGMKLVLPLDKLTGPVELPGWFMRFIGVCEMLGGLGLILPGLLRIRPGLTPLAAVGLVIIMIGAIAITLKGALLPAALMSLVVGLLAAFVAYGRWRLAPHPSARPVVRPAR